jgi:hypothetical protein
VGPEWALSGLSGKVPLQRRRGSLKIDAPQGCVPRYVGEAFTPMSIDAKRPLGKILLQRKLVPRELLGALREENEAALVGASSTPRSPREGPKDAELLALLALAHRSGVPGLDLRQVNIMLDHLDVVPLEVAEAFRILPVLLRDDRLYLAMADPSNTRARDELEFVTGRAVHPFVAVPSTLVHAIASAYAAKARGDREYRGSSYSPVSSATG